MNAAIKMHLSLNVADMDRSVAFYEAFLGVAVHKRRPGYANFDLNDPPLKLALNQVPRFVRGNALDHLGVQVGAAEAVQAARARLIASGLASFDEGDTVCCYARQDKVWAHDPDGNQWEVYVLLDELEDSADEAFGPSGTVAASVSSCCASSAQMKAGGPVCCAQPADGSACCND